jgi:hypothetical protein
LPQITQVITRSNLQPTTPGQLAQINAVFMTISVSSKSLEVDESESDHATIAFSPNIGQIIYLKRDSEIMALDLGAVP